MYRGEFVRKVASGLDYAIEVTTDGHAFKQRYDAFDPTVAVVDLVMPEVEGMELVQWLARREARARIIVVTGYAPDYASLAKMLAEGRGLKAVNTPTKPVKVSLLRHPLGDAGDDLEAKAKHA